MDAAYAPPPSSDNTVNKLQLPTIMKAFICVVLLATAALAAPEGKRDKRGYLHGYSGLSYGHGYDHGFGHGYDDIHLGHSAFLDHAPARIVSINKVVEVPKVVEVKKIVSVPRVVTVPRVVKVSRIVEEPHVHVSYKSYAHAPLSAGWW